MNANAHVCCNKIGDFESSNQWVHEQIFILIHSNSLWFVNPYEKKKLQNKSV